MVGVVPLLFPVPVLPIAALVGRQLPVGPIGVLRPQRVDIGLRRTSQLAKVALVESCAVLERHAGMVPDEMIAVVKVLLLFLGEPIPPASELLRLSELLGLVENPRHRARIRIAIGAVKQTNRASAAHQKTPLRPTPVWRSKRCTPYRRDRDARSMR